MKLPACDRCANQPGRLDLPSPANDNIRRIYVLSDRDLRQRQQVQQIGLGLKSLNIPRRDIPNWIADMIYQEDIECRYPCGKIYDLNDTLIDEVFPDIEHCRWMSDIIAYHRRLPKQRPQERILPRLRLLELALFLDDRIDRSKRRRT